MLLLAGFAHATSPAAPVRQRQVYASVHVAWRIGADHPIAAGLGGSARWAPGFGDVGPEAGAFARAEWVFGEGTGGAVGGVGGWSGLDRAPVGYVPTWQVDASLGLAWDGGLGPWVGVGAAKALDFVGATCAQCGDGPLEPFSLRVDAGAAWVDGLHPRVQPALQAALGSREYPL